MSVWDIFCSVPGWERLDADNDKVVECVLAANGQYAEETLTELIGHDFVEAFETPYGVCVLVDDGDEMLMKSFHGRDTLGAMTHFAEIAKQAGYGSFRYHTSKKPFLRLLRKLGKEPHEYVFREFL